MSTPQALRKFKPSRRDISNDLNVVSMVGRPEPGCSQPSWCALLPGAARANANRYKRALEVVAFFPVAIAFLLLANSRNIWDIYGVQIRKINVRIRKDTFEDFYFLPCWHFLHILKVPEISLVGCAVTLRSIDILTYFITNFKTTLAAVILYHNGLIRCIFTNKTHFR